MHALKLLQYPALLQLPSHSCSLQQHPAHPCSIRLTPAASGSLLMFPDSALFFYSLHRPPTLIVSCFHIRAKCRRHLLGSVWNRKAIKVPFAIAGTPADKVVTRASSSYAPQADEVAMIGHTQGYTFSFSLSVFLYFFLSTLMYPFFFSFFLSFFNTQFAFPSFFLSFFLLIFMSPFFFISFVTSHVFFYPHFHSYIFLLLFFLVYFQLNISSLSLLEILPFFFLTSSLVLIFFLPLFSFEKLSSSLIAFRFTSFGYLRAFFHLFVFFFFSRLSLANRFLNHEFLIYTLTLNSPCLHSLSRTAPS
ncbi:unnamed protein product [Acanthosepion pharaonis]|uniref:Uncharacterized protein n=1 Tax=Acanthosepion pharaonis TaxID=158019 RepID=A0A812B5P2_ACAPH|nr:unnamed protein product [Sepia pharaonis]